MSTKIVVCDSGVGGLAVLKKLVNALPFAKFYYLSDCKNMPYGNKEADALKKLCIKKINFANRVGASCLVVACNTLATVGAEVFKNEKSLKIFYVLPPVQKIANFPLEKTKIFCTEATAKSPLLSEIITKNPTTVMPLKNLAKDVEENIFDLHKINLDFLNEINLEKGRVYLSCTHYIHLADFFKIHFPSCEIFDGTEDLIDDLTKNFTFLNLKGKNCKIRFRGAGKCRMKRVYKRLLTAKN